MKDDDLTKRLSKMSRDELKNAILNMVQDGLPEGITVVTCGVCTGPLFGVYSLSHDSLGYWCATCKSGGATQNVAVVEVDGKDEVVNIHHIPDTVANAMDRHSELHTPNPN